MILSGAQMNAPSMILLLTSDLVSTFSRFQIQRCGLLLLVKGVGPASVAERAIALGHGRIALRRRAVAAAARRTHQDDVTAIEHVLPAVVDRDTVDLHVAEPAMLAAREAGRLELRALGHERREDRRIRLALEADVLPEAAAEAPAPARARSQALLVEEQGAVALGHLDRRRRDVARPGEDALARSEEHTSELQSL